MSRAILDPSSKRLDVADCVDDMALLRRYVDFASQEAFSELVGRHLTWVYSTCYKALRDREMAEDASQAVFIILARRASTITPQTRISGWLFNTARFVVKDARKQQARYRRREEIARELASERMVVRPPSVDTEMQSSLDDAMATLTERDRQALLMHFYEGLSLNEMAEVLGIGKEGVKKRVGRALSRLRGRLNAKRAASIFAVAVMLRGRMAEALPMGFHGSVVAGVSTPGRASVAAEWMARQAIRASAGASQRLLRAALATELVSAVAVVGIYSSQSARQTSLPARHGPIAAVVDYGTSRAGGVVQGGVGHGAIGGQPMVGADVSGEPPYRSGADDSEPKVTPLPPYSSGATAGGSQGVSGAGGGVELMGSGGPVGVASAAPVTKRAISMDPLPLPPLSQRMLMPIDTTAGVGRSTGGSGSSSRSNSNSSSQSSNTTTTDRSNGVASPLVQRPSDGADAEDVVSRCIALVGQGHDGMRPPGFGDEEDGRLAQQQSGGGPGNVPATATDHFLPPGAGQHHDGAMPGRGDEFVVVTDSPKDGHMRRMFIDGDDDGANKAYGRRGWRNLHGSSAGGDDQHPYTVVATGDEDFGQLVGRVPPTWVLGKPPRFDDQHPWHHADLGLCGEPSLPMGGGVLDGWSNGAAAAAAAGAQSVPEPGLMGAAALVMGALTGTGRRRRH